MSDKVVLYGVFILFFILFFIIIPMAILLYRNQKKIEQKAEQRKELIEQSRQEIEQARQEAEQRKELIEQSRQEIEQSRQEAEQRAKLIEQKIQKTVEYIQTEHQKLDQKKERLETLEHTMLHDLKTNIDINLSTLSIIYNNLQEKAYDDMDNLIIKMYALDLTIKLSNDYNKATPLSVPNFYDVLKNENIINFCKGTYESMGAIGEKILKDIIQVHNIDIDFSELTSFPLDNFYQNQFSSLVFRLINNAIKHSTDHKAIVIFEKDKYNDLVLSVKNKIKNKEKVEYNLNTSFEANDDIKNITIIKNTISKFKMKLIKEFETEDKNTYLVLKIIKDN